MSGRPIPKPKPEPPQVATPGSETDVAELAALFAAHGGGNVSPEISAELALEIVLHEIVEQACLATGATGSAVILEREGEMVCRASSGINAPELGAKLDSETGLTAECIKSRQMQRCDDALTDPRADAEASRILGVRSVLVLPITCNDALIGVLEAFSSRRAAFHERDEHTLEALGQRILKNLQRASDPPNLAPPVVDLPPDLPPKEDFISAATVASGGLHVVPAPPIVDEELEHSAESEEEMTQRGLIKKQEDRPAPTEPAPLGGLYRNNNKDKVEDNQSGPSTQGVPRAKLDPVTIALWAAVVACVVLLVALLDMRMTRIKAASRAPGTPAGVASQPNQTMSPAPATSHSTQPSGEAGAGKKSAASRRTSAPDNTNDSSPPVPPGSLLVYEDGREVFRMMPHNAAAAKSSAPKRASAAEPEQAHEQVIDLSPQLAQGSLQHRVEPDYPEEALRQGIQGAVVLDVRIGRDGNVQEAKPVSGPNLLTDAAIAAVKQWRFKPRAQNGQAVEMQTRVTLNFRLPQ